MYLFSFTIPLTILHIVINVFVQIIVLLYVIDNNENISWMILCGSGTGVIVEAWKVVMFSVKVKVVVSGNQRTGLHTNLDSNSIELVDQY